MKKTIICILALIFICGNIFSYTYGYIIMRGKNEKQMDDGLKMFEMHVNSWKNGEMLYTGKESRGALFFKKYIYTVILKGNADEVRNLLQEVPWESDILKDVTLAVKYKNATVEPVVETTIYKKFPNPKLATDFISKPQEYFHKLLSREKKRPYQVFKNRGLEQMEITINFYSTSVSEKNLVVTLIKQEAKLPVK